MILKIKGKNQIQGELDIYGAKNSAVSIIPAAILCDGIVTIRNIPDISDVRIMLEILTDIGYDVTFNNHIVTIKKNKKPSWVIKNTKATSLRGSYYFYGAMLSQFKKVSSFLPGGCKLGSRPIDYHLEVFKSLNCSYKIKDNIITIKTRKLKASIINLPYPSVGATINAILASCKAKGTTYITNYAREPEVIDTINFLKSMGSIIKITSDRLEITGVKRLHPTDYTIICDRIEAGSYLLMGCIKKFKYLTVNNVDASLLTSVLDVILKIGGRYEITNNSITVFPPEVVKAINLETGPYPGFPTDLAQVLTVILLQDEATSSITEKIFSDRFSHIYELSKMKANITLDGATYQITGGSKLTKADMEASDLRGAFSLVCASLLVNAFSTISNIEVIFRGYNDFFNNLDKLKLNYSIIE